MKNLETATFGAGCFWGVQYLLKRIDGVIETRAGYMGGDLDNPTYKEVKTGRTNHAEVVEVKYDPTKVSYETLLDYFWRLHDPTTLNRQGVDEGTQYRSVIFYHNDLQKKAAEKSKEAFDQSKVFKERAVTQIANASKFYSAEDYHQDYFDVNGGHVCHILRPR